MRAVCVAGLAALVVGVAGAAQAAPLLPPGRCGCTLAEVLPPPVEAWPDPGYAPELSLDEIAVLRRLDDAHEPLPEPTLWAWVCLPLPRVPGRPSGPGAAVPGAVLFTFDGIPVDGVALDGVPLDGPTVPEPGGLALVAALAVWRRRR